MMFEMRLVNKPNFALEQQPNNSMRKYGCRGYDASPALYLMTNENCLNEKNAEKNDADADVGDDDVPMTDSIA